MRTIAERSLEDDLAFWQGRLSGAPELIQLPTDRPRSTQGLYTIARVPLRLSRALILDLQESAWQLGLSLFQTLLGSWVVLIARWSGQDDIVIGARVPRHLPNQAFPLAEALESVPLRFQLQEDWALGELAQYTKTLLTQSAEHLSVPLSKLFAANRYRPPIPRVAIEYSDVSNEGLRSSLTQMKATSTKTADELDLSIDLTDEGRRLSTTLGYAQELFDRGTAERLLASWQVLLEGMVKDPLGVIGRLPILTPAARQRALYAFNDTAAPYPEDYLIHELFEEYAQRTPHAVAVMCGQDVMTFGELNARANQLARFLKHKGVGPGRRVASLVERDIEMVIGLLAILKAGGAYVPLDPTYPVARLTYMLEDASPGLLLTQKRLRGLLPDPKTEVLEIDGDWDAIARADIGDLPRSALLTPLHPAYVIYTSGSTGAPKGAVNEHRGMVNRIFAHRAIECFDERDVCCQKTFVSFVDAVFEIFGTLCNGRPLVMIPAAAVKDGAQMAELIERHGVTRLITIPSLAGVMLEDPAVVRRLQGLRSWTLSGEPVRIQVLRDLQEALPRCEFINLYGASEVSSDATYFKWRRFDGERLPVGWPVPNARIYILDRHGEPVPLGVTGEIHVGGVGVGQGYLNRPELTQSRFVPDPFSGVPHGRLYKTGDLGRWRADGLLECLGRADQQVKVRGFRIELSEIETQLVRHPQVKEALVTAREDVPGERRLVAYVTRRETADRGVLSERLRAYLKEQLPEFMVPGAVVLLETLPRTPNGKLDRRSLPPPAPQDYTDHEYESPRGELEEALADIWKELLGIERVGRANNFFDLGGDSLSAARVITRIGHLLELRVPLAAFFEEPTLQGLGKSILTQIVTETSMEVS